MNNPITSGDIYYFLESVKKMKKQGFEVTVELHKFKVTPISSMAKLLMRAPDSGIGWVNNTRYFQTLEQVEAFVDGVTTVITVLRSDPIGIDETYLQTLIDEHKTYAKLCNTE